MRPAALPAPWLASSATALLACTTALLACATALPACSSAPPACSNASALPACSSASSSAPTPARESASPPTPPSTAGMVRVPEGTFTRGHSPASRPDEFPPHTVHVHAFSIDRTLVTRDAFARFAQATGYLTTAERQGFGVGSREGMADWEWERIPHASWRNPYIEADAETPAFERPDSPVVMVSFEDATAFCQHAGKRLPTEAEWEYAMRAGSSGTRYPWGESPERDGKLALNFWQGVSHRHNLREDGFLYVSPVTAFPPNAWGIHDPVGNVWQWTADWYAPDTYARAAKAGGVVDPKGPETGAARVLRGGSWWCGACTCEGNGLHYRGKAIPSAAFNNNGFRCAAD